MINRYKSINIELDVHTHTIASGHAYSSLQEMVASASAKGLKLLGITEHGPAVEGTCSPIYFKNMRVIPRIINNVRLLLGAEINILNCEGQLDMDQQMMNCLNLCIAGIHNPYYKQGNREENTDGLLKVIRNPYIHIISHPGDGTADLNFEPLVLAAKEYHTLLEINNSSLNPVREKKQARQNNIEILSLCKHYDVPVILGSDAHISYDIANYEFIYPLLAETEFPINLIINQSVDSFKKYLGI